MDQKDERILSLRNEGRSLRGIGRELGFSHVAVRKRLKRLLDEDGNQKPEALQNDTIYVETVNQAGKVVTKKVERTWNMGLSLNEIDNVINRLKGMMRDSLEGGFGDEDIIFITYGGWKVESVYR